MGSLQRFNSSSAGLDQSPSDRRASPAWSNAEGVMLLNSCWLLVETQTRNKHIWPYFSFSVWKRRNWLVKKLRKKWINGVPSHGKLGIFFSSVILGMDFFNVVSWLHNIIYNWMSFSFCSCSFKFVGFVSLEKQNRTMESSHLFISCKMLNFIWIWQNSD